MEKQITITVNSESNKNATENLIDYLSDCGYSSYTKKGEQNVLLAFCDNNRVDVLKDCVLDGSELFNFDYSYSN